MTKRDAVVDDVHGVKIARSLSLARRRDRPDVKAWMATEDKLARQFIATLPGRDKLAARLKELYLSRLGVAAARTLGARYFYMRTHKNKREGDPTTGSEGENGPEKVLIDPNTLSGRRHDLARRVDAVVGRQDARLRLKPNNSDETILHVMDVASGKISDVDIIPGAQVRRPVVDAQGRRLLLHLGAAALDKVDAAPSGPGFAEVRFHALGADPAADPIIHERRAIRRPSSARKRPKTATGSSPTCSMDGTPPTSIQGLAQEGRRVAAVRRR